MTTHPRPGLRVAVTLLFWGALAFLSVHSAHAQGMKVQEGGPSHGNAGAGTAATADDATTVYFNPAGMTGLRGDHGALIVKAVDFGIHFVDGGSTGVAGGRTTGSGSADAGKLGVLPGLFLVSQHDDLWVGLGVNVPFGLATDYGRTWTGRYHATRSELQIVNINPAVAWRLDERWSVGVGLDAQYMDVTLENAIDFGGIAVDRLGAGPAGQLGLAPQRDDGDVRITGDSWGFGANAGVHLRVDESTRLGLSWRSSVEHRLDGRARFRVPRDARRLTAAGDFRDSGVKADFSAPQSVLLGVSHELDDEWTAVGGFEWTDWSQFRQIKVEYDGPGREDSIERQDWEDTTRTMAGLIWRPSPDWTLRVGAAYDSSPVGLRTRRARLPDAARKTISFGLGYRIDEGSTLELGYMRAWWSDARIDRTEELAGRLRGEADNDLNFVGLTLTLDF